MPSVLKKIDPALYRLIKAEEARQQNKLSLIPSENFFSPAVREAVGSVFMHKYAEGNIGHRYYEGCENIDELEKLTIARATKVFHLPENWGVNVQALSGSNANLAAYLAILNPGDTILSLYLPDGGHLSHGWSYEPKHTEDPNNPVYLGGSRKVNITTHLYRIVQYKTSPKNQRLDYDEIAHIARQYQPKLIITGGTAYPRLINHRRIKKIAAEINAYYLADIAHEAGLVAGGVIPSPVGIADVVTMTTHKTLRAGRGALILAEKSLIKKINKAILPGLQGGPHYHNIAGICAGLGEALKPAFKTYAKQILINTHILATELKLLGFKLVTGGADKHLILINLTGQPLLGRKLARALDYAGIVTNFNTMPQETRSPSDPSALRLGTPWITTRGLKEKHMSQVAGWIGKVLTFASPWADLKFLEFESKGKASPDLARIAQEVKTFCKKFPLEF